MTMPNPRTIATLIALMILTACGGTTSEFATILPTGPGVADIKDGQIVLGATAAADATDTGTLHQGPTARSYFANDLAVTSADTPDVLAMTATQMGRSSTTHGGLIARRDPLDLPRQGTALYFRDGGYQGHVTQTSGSGNTLRLNENHVTGDTFVEVSFENARISGQIQNRQLAGEGGTAYFGNIAAFSAVPILEGGTFAATPTGGAFRDAGGAALPVEPGEVRGLIAGPNARTVAGYLEMRHTLENGDRLLETGVFVADRM